MPGVGDRLRTHVANAVQQIQAEVRGIQDEVGALYIPSVLTPHQLLTEHGMVLCAGQGAHSRRSYRPYLLKCFNPARKRCTVLSGNPLWSISNGNSSRNRFKWEGILESNVTRVQRYVWNQETLTGWHQNPRTLRTNMGRGGPPRSCYWK